MPPKRKLANSKARTVSSKKAKPNNGLDPYDSDPVISDVMMPDASPLMGAFQVPSSSEALGPRKCSLTPVGL